MKSNPMGPAAAEGVPASTTPTRRAVMIGAAATAAAIAGTSAATDPALAAIPSWMALKIEAHREAAAAEERACDECEVLRDLRRRQDDENPIEVKVVGHTGHAGYYNFTIHGRAGVEQAIREVTRTMVCIAVAGHSMPLDIDGLRPALEIVRQVEADNLSALAKAEAAHRQRHAMADDADQRSSDATRRAEAALLALCSERPRSVKDAADRARYLRDADVVLDDDQLAALLTSTAAMEG